MLFILCIYPDSHLVWFSSVWWTSYNTSSSLRLLLMNSFSFYVSEKVYCLHFWKIFCLVKSCMLVFIFCTSKMFDCLLACTAFDEKFSISITFVLLNIMCLLWLLSFIFIFLFFIFSFLGLHLKHMVLGLGVESEAQLLPYTTATATKDPSHICDLHHSSWQCQILNPLSEARDRTCILMGTNRIHNLLSHNGNSLNLFFIC